jgi:hypothetical protein
MFMPILITLSDPNFDQLLFMARPTTAEYATLFKAKMVKSHETDIRAGTTRIYCKIDEAQGLLTLARRSHCAAVPEIERSMGLEPRMV